MYLKKHCIETEFVSFYALNGFVINNATASFDIVLSYLSLSELLVDNMQYKKYYFPHCTPDCYSLVISQPC